ncbi:MAG: glycerol-3-phosphate dehydrogenase/oxidase [Anaerolineaceae bacterium]
MTVVNPIPEDIEPLHRIWDAIIIGGGITGAGIFRDLAAQGYQVLLIDQNDFGFGTSSRSSKLVHGGLRYLANAQFHVTYESVRERELLQKEYPGLVRPLQFLLPIYDHYKYGASFFRVGIGMYDLFGSKWKHGTYTNTQIDKDFSHLNRTGLDAVLYYYDAEVDDARLVYRVISEGLAHGGMALNYKKCSGFLRTTSGKVEGVQIKDTLSGKESELHSQVVINATGPWTDELRSQLTSEKVIRKLRGSHILFSQERVPVKYAFTLFHPSDGRALFVIPWQGMTMVGTTDLDHPESFEREKPEPFMTSKEMEYLLEAVNSLFPDLDIGEQDIISSFAGLRPIVSMGAMDPSKASRTHRIFEDNNMFSIAGGKLTTFQRMAEDLVKRVHPLLPDRKPTQAKRTSMQQDSAISIKDDNLEKRLSGIYGTSLPDFLTEAKSDEIESLPGTPYTLAEVRWAVRHEMIRHLSDLMLRRTRLGLVSPHGGTDLLDAIKPVVKQELNWPEAIWIKEMQDYKKLWKDCYSIPLK